MQSDLFSGFIKSVLWFIFQNFMPMSNFLSIYFQDDVDVTAIAVPELIKLLSDPDTSTSRQAANTLYQESFNL